MISFWHGLALSAVALAVAVVALILFAAVGHVAGIVALVALATALLFAFVSRWPWQR
jgi:hypothetical protein